MPPREAVAIALVCSVATGVPGILAVRQSINLRRLAVFLLPALLGVPLGFVALSIINAPILSSLVGLMLLVYGGYFAFRRNLPELSGNWTFVEVGIGFVGGVLGAMAGLSGALLNVAGDASPGVQRGILQPFNMVILTVATVMLATDGGFDARVLRNLALTLPASAVGAGIGLWLFSKLSDNAYRRLLIGLMLVSGIVLLGRTLLT